MYSIGEHSISKAYVMTMTVMTAMTVIAAAMDGSSNWMNILLAPAPHEFSIE